MTISEKIAGLPVAVNIAEPFQAQLTQAKPENGRKLKFKEYFSDLVHILLYVIRRRGEIWQGDREKQLRKKSRRRRS